MEEQTKNLSDDKVLKLSEAKRQKLLKKTRLFIIMRLIIDFLLLIMALISLIFIFNNNFYLRKLKSDTSSQDLQNYYNLVNDSDISETFYPTNSDNFPDFATLSGFESEKRIANSFILYVKKPEKFKNLGLIDPPSGILLYGTPGTGKTTFARAIAKETQLPFFEVSASIFSKKYRGQAVQMIRNLFRDVRKISKKYPGVILFIDECETIFCKLERLSGDAEIMNIVNQFKTELTSVENDPEHPIFILGATNNFMQIDDAIKSRFTYSIKVNPGNKKERRKFLEFLMEQKLKNPYSLEAKNFLYEVINEALERIDTTKNYDFLKTNRTLENLMKSAAMNFATKKASNDDDSKETVDIDDLKEAYSRIIVTDTDLTILNQVEQELKNQQS
ncbi:MULTISPECIES: AAA family ATPase [Candidatus Phytoplasma]|uniref:ATP-dependent Zn protease n=2 Tax=Candidatus Phytoplasma TaxID=33926 RepID=A0ABP2TG73_PEWBP|nr:MULTISPECIES: AAA family ATPase [Phytoplasma]QLL36987.1 ATP-dependent Zn protease ['Echinacea purpurea' witches'-broom phytoplasma]WEX20293.1 MAG: proteasome regulatory subunit [Candidatus Phytoplasma aurantifolia]WKV64238.1 MAG: ATP-dependent Zn protease [Candidatus Phytoplasma australasiaticum]EMR14690.1 ATP-dependent Zn protease [Peanut witches'-broom phytoplasma NTU2011]MDO8052509.1 AAA family ATPase ['Vigna radiata' phytoplasma]